MRPPDAEVVDLGDATLLPGFIDAHVHLTDEHNPDWAKGFAVEQSFYADIVAVPGDVLADIHATESPRLVVRRGRIVRRDD